MTELHYQRWRLLFSIELRLVSSAEYSRMGLFVAQFWSRGKNAMISLVLVFRLKFYASFRTKANYPECRIVGKMIKMGLFARTGICRTVDFHFGNTNRLTEEIQCFYFTRQAR